MKNLLDKNKKRNKQSAHPTFNISRRRVKYSPVLLFARLVLNEKTNTNAMGVIRFAT